MIAVSKLVDLQEKTIRRGNILRVPGRHPYENYVDFMVFETQCEDRPYGLIISSGYKAGLILIRLPKESFGVGGGIDKEWTISNWDKWIYPDCNVSEVFLIDGYEAISVVGM
jgi:hypothetical protein